MIDAIKNLPCMERLFTRNAHARKMAIAALIVKDASVNAAALAEALYSDELLAAAENGMLPFSAYAPICRRGKMTGKMAQSIVECFPVLLSDAGDFTSPKTSSMLHIALAHPELPAETWQLVSRRKDSFPPDVKHALAASHHAPVKERRRAELGWPNDSAMLPRCTFGNLTDETTRMMVMLWLPYTKDGVLSLAVELLVSNPTFNADMAGAMHDTLFKDKLEKLPPSLLRRFSETHEDIEHVNKESGACRFAKIFHAGEVVFSPELAEDGVTRHFFDVALEDTSGDVERASYILNRACPESVFDRLVKDGNVHLGTSGFAGGRFDSKILALARDGKIPFKQLSADFLCKRDDATSADLSMFFQCGVGSDQNVVKVCSHDNFDFSCLPDKMRKQPSIAIIETCAGKREALASDAAKNPLVALFSEQTSSFRLDQIFAKLPVGLRRMAAAHPNGGDIPLDPDDPLDAKIARFRKAFFQEPLLAARQGKRDDHALGEEIVL